MHSMKFTEKKTTKLKNENKKESFNIRRFFSPFFLLLFVAIFLLSHLILPHTLQSVFGGKKIRSCKMKKKKKLNRRQHQNSLNAISLVYATFTLIFRFFLACCCYFRSLFYVSVSYYLIIRNTRKTIFFLPSSFFSFLFFLLSSIFDEEKKTFRPLYAFFSLLFGLSLFFSSRIE